MRKIIYSLKRVKKIFPRALCIQLYKSLLLPHIEYGLEIYGNAKQINRINKLHKWGIRNATNSKYNAHTLPLYKNNNILTLNDLYETKCRYLIRERIALSTPKKITEMFTYHASKNRKQFVVEQLFPVNRFYDSLSSFKIPRIWNENRPRKLGLSPKAFKNNIKKSIVNLYDTKCNKKPCYTCSTVN